MLATAAAVLGVGNPPACGILAVAMAYRLLELTQERGEVGVCSPRAWIGRGSSVGWPATRTGGEVVTGSWRRRSRGSSGVPGFTDRCAGFLLRCYRG